MKRASVLVLFALLALAIMPVFAQSFILIAPSGTTLIRALPSDLPAFRWQPVTGATDYDLYVFKVSNNPRATPLGQIFTANVAAGSCAAECSYTPSGGEYALMDHGQFSWTVVADMPVNDIEASNAPILFSVNRYAIALLANPGFETGSLAPWKDKGLAGDKVKAGTGVSNSWGFIFKGGPGENAKLTQKANVASLGIDASDTLSFSTDYRATSASVQAEISLKVIYTVASGLTTDKVTLPVVPNANYVAVSTNVVPDGPVEKIKVQVKHSTTGGKFFVDNIQVVLAGQP